MATYAKQTKVSADKSRTEIEQALVRYGASAFVYGWDGPTVAAIGFRIADRMVRIRLPLPDPADKAFTRDRYGYARAAKSAATLHDQAVRQRWRALVLIVKAKLEAIEAGISTVEEEFLSGVMLPDGSTAGDWLRPQLEAAYRAGQMPALLPGLERPALPAPSAEQRG